jgi:ketose-bisphosphate aldolase
MAHAAFNVFDYDSIRAIVDAADELNERAYLQFSASTVKYYGAEIIAEMIKLACRKNRRCVIVHLDHCADFDLMKSCIDNGWDSIMGDFSHQSLEQNIKNMLKLKHLIGQRQILVEGELGQVAGVEDGYGDEGGSFVNLEDVSHFTEQTNIDLLAIGIGNAHGFYSSTDNIDIPLLAAVHCRIPKQKLVLHGGTGIENEKIQQMKSLGIVKINISTELKSVYMNAENEHFGSSGKFNMMTLVNLRYEMTKKLALKKILEFK